MALDPRQLLNDSEETQRILLTGWQSGIWTAMPCIVQSVNYEAMTLIAQPSIKGNVRLEDGTLTSVLYPLLVDVPIMWPSSGGFAVTFPIVLGDEVLVVFASRCIDSWWQSGGIGLPMETRMHDLSDGFAIPGPHSQPSVFPSISTTDLQVRNKLGTTFVSIGADGRIGFQNPTTSLKTTLTNLESLLNTFMGVLAAFSGGSSPVTQTMLQTPAAAAQTSLAAVLVEIDALLK